MTTFDHDKIIAHVINVNPRNETHGDDLVLAVDVKIRATKAENEATWPDLIDDLFDDLTPDDAMRIIEQIHDSVKSIPFLAAGSAQKVNFWQGNRKPAAFSEANVNHISWESDKGAQSLVMRIQSTADGEQIGALSELLGMKVRIELVSTQQDLPFGTLDEEPDSDDTGDEN